MKRIQERITDRRAELKQIVCHVYASQEHRMVNGCTSDSRRHSKRGAPEDAETARMGGGGVHGVLMSIDVGHSQIVFIYPQTAVQGSHRT